MCAHCAVQAHEKQNHKNRSISTSSSNLSSCCVCSTDLAIRMVDRQHIFADPVLWIHGKWTNFAWNASAKRNKFRFFSLLPHRLTVLSFSDTHSLQDTFCRSHAILRGDFEQLFSFSCHPYGRARHEFSQQPKMSRSVGVRGNTVASTKWHAHGNSRNCLFILIEFD